jgi:hypothetical protein
MKEYPYRSPRFVFRNLGNGRFKNVTSECGPAAQKLESSRGCAFGDYDNDGDIDVLIMNMNAPPSLLRNDYVNAENRKRNNWIKLKLTGTKSNRSAVGARVLLKAAGLLLTQEITSQSSYYSHNDSRLHFGLGEEGKVDSIEIRWPNGNIEVVKDVAVNRIVTIKEGSGVVEPATKK